MTQNVSYVRLQRIISASYVCISIAFVNPLLNPSHLKQGALYLLLNSIHSKRIFNGFFNKPLGIAYRLLKEHGAVTD